MQLQSTLEQRLGLELDDDAIAAAQTLGDLRELLEQQTGISYLSHASDAPAITALENHTPTSPPDEAFASTPHDGTTKDK